MAALLIAGGLATPGDPAGTAATFVPAAALCIVATLGALRLPRLLGGTLQSRRTVEPLAGTRPAAFGPVLRAPHMGKAP